MKNYQLYFISCWAFLNCIKQRNCEVDGFTGWNVLSIGLDIVETIEPIPDHQTVKLLHNKIDDSMGDVKLSFDAFGEKKNVHMELLEPTLIGDRTPIWLAKHDWMKNEVFFERLSTNRLGDENNLYETSEGSIIGSGTDENGEPYFVGSVEDLMITPVQPKQLNMIQREKRDDYPNESSLASRYHFIYRNKKLLDNNEFQSQFSNSHMNK